MLEAKAMNVAIFLDEERVQRPAHVHPRQPQQRLPRGTTPAPWLSAVDHRQRRIRQLCQGRHRGAQGAGGLDDPLPRLPCTPPANLSPWNRVSVYLSLCAVSNHIRRFKAPEYIAHRDFTPIAMLPDDCLTKPYPVDLPEGFGTPPFRHQTEKAA